MTRTLTKNDAAWRQRKAELLAKTTERRVCAGGAVELRTAAGGGWTLDGYACRTGVTYEVGFYNETIEPGAFRRTLGENPDVQLLINHGGMPLARTRGGTLQLEEDDLGLHVQADLDPQDPDAQALRRKLARKDLDQMSFAFRVNTGGDEWSDDHQLRTIRSLSIHRGDVSVVNMGASESTSATMRALQQAARRSDVALIEARAAQQRQELDLLRGRP